MTAASSASETAARWSPGLATRHYGRSTSSAPLLVFLHGGMWVLADLDTHDRLCRQIAAEAGVEVLAVDYRRAPPEDPWLAPVDDAVAAVRRAVLEWRVIATATAGGAYDNVYCGGFEIGGGQISAAREYFDTRHAADVLVA